MFKRSFQTSRSIAHDPVAPDLGTRTRLLRLHHEGLRAVGNDGVPRRGEQQHKRGDERRS